MDEALKAAIPVEETLAVSKKLIAEQPPKIKAAEQAIAAFQPELQNAEAAFAALSKEAVARQVDLETSLVAAGSIGSIRQAGRTDFFPAVPGLPQRADRQGPLKHGKLRQPDEGWRKRYVGRRQ